MEENNEIIEANEKIETEDIAEDTDEPTLYGKEFFNIERHNLITGTAVRLFSANAAARIQEILTPINQRAEKSGSSALLILLANSVLPTLLPHYSRK